MTTRRSFLSAMLAASAAPMYIKYEILMPVRKIITLSDHQILSVDGTAFNKIGAIGLTYHKDEFWFHGDAKRVVYSWDVFVAKNNC